MLRFRRLGLIQVSCLEKGKFIHNTLLESIMAAEAEEKRAKSDEITFIVLVTIFILLFFARNLTIFLILLSSGLGIGIFWLIKDYKERRGKTMKRRRIFRIIERGIKFLKELLLGGAKFRW